LPCLINYLPKLRTIVFNNCAQMTMSLFLILVIRIMFRETKLTA
jgi:hypothetical protein